MGTLITSGSATSGPMAPLGLGNCHAIGVYLVLESIRAARGSRGQGMCSSHGSPALARQLLTTPGRWPYLCVHLTHLTFSSILDGIGWFKVAHPGPRLEGSTTWATLLVWFCWLHLATTIRNSGVDQFQRLKIGPCSFLGPSRASRRCPAMPLEQIPNDNMCGNRNNMSYFLLILRDFRAYGAYSKCHSNGFVWK
jgi:hypothetical protein